MARGYRRWLAASVLAIVVALGGLVAAGFQEPRGQRQTLPDGTVLEYVGSTFGRDHTIGVGNWWQRLYGFLFPLRAPVVAPRVLIGIYPYFVQPLRSKFAPPAANPPEMIGSRAHFVSAKDEPVLWFRVTPPKQPGAIGGVGVHRWTAAIDAHGCRIPCGADEVGIPTFVSVGEWPGHPEQGLALAEVRNYNRREGRFRFAFFEDESERPVAEFPGVNPILVHPSEWTARRQPVISQQQGMTFALDDLSHLQVVRGGVTETARFVPLRGRKRAPFWDVKQAEVSDATGNQWPAFRVGYNRAYFGGLCRREPAWKITAEFEEDWPGRDPPDFTCTFRDIPVPAPGHSVHCNEASGRGNEQVTVTGIAAPPSTASRDIGAWLAFRVSTSSRPAVSLLSVRDEYGRSLQGVGWELDQALPGGRRGSLRLPPLRGARRLQIVLGEFRPRRAEFFVHP